MQLPGHHTYLMRISILRARYLLLCLPLALIGIALERPTDRASQAVTSAPHDWKEQLAARAASHSDPPQDGLADFHAIHTPVLIPSPIRRRMAHSLGPHPTTLGISLRDGYFLNTANGIGLWVLRGEHVVCIFNGRTLAMACDTAADTARYGLVVVSGPSPQFYKHPLVEAVGIAPDGVRAVRLELMGRSDRVVSIVNNTFALRAHQPILVKGVVR